MGMNSINENKPDQKKKEEEFKKKQNKEISPKEEVESNFIPIKFKFS